jgi:hypothetical protein
MINTEEKLNLSVSGGSDLNQELVENSDYTKSTPESEMMNNDGIESSGMNKGESMLTGGGSSKPDKTSMMGGTPEDDYDKEDQEGGNSVGNYSNDDTYKKSEMNKKMDIEKDNKEDGNEQPSKKENTLTKSDVPYDVPNDQTPRMSDMPNNIENMTKKGDNSEPASE